MLHSYQKQLNGDVGIVFGCFAPLHQGHLDLIMRAKKENAGGAIVIVCGYEGDKGGDLMPLSKRYRYVREFFADDDLVAVYVDRTFDNPISATMIRQNPIKYWDKIALPFKRVFSTNILITGTASEGKSTLVNDLGKYFNAPHSHEWARDYMAQKCISDWELDCADFLAFLEGQYKHNRDEINSPGNRGFFFADTDSLVTNMYSKYYSKDPSCILTEDEYETKIKPVAYEYARRCRWDKIFCVVPHGTFVDDHERFMAHSGMKERRELYEILKESLEELGEWDKVTILDGDYYENFMAIVNYVKEIEKKWERVRKITKE